MSVAVLNLNNYFYRPQIASIAYYSNKQLGDGSLTSKKVYESEMSLVRGSILVRQLCAEQILFDKFENNNVTIHFTHPVEVNILREKNDLYRLSFDQLNIRIVDTSREAVIEYFFEVLAYYYETYFSAPRYKLSGDALLFSKWFSNNTYQIK